MSARGITIVGASAGSGKTYRLTEVVSGAIDPAGEHRLGLESLVAVTYTRKAHAELQARIRRTLVGAGAFDEALRLPLAYLGTVHAACLRLLQEFAIDAGLSPNVDVVAEDAGKLLRQSLEASLEPVARARLEGLAARFKLRWDPKIKRTEWLTPVADIMDLARSNRIAPEDLAGMAERSAVGLVALLPVKEEKDGDAIDDALVRELARAAKALAKANDEVGATMGAIELCAEATRQLRDGALDWPTWAKLAQVKGSKGTDALVVNLREVASRYEAHPRYRAELRELTLAVYDAARVGLSSYQTWKERRRVVDYVDMLDRAYGLVSHPRVASELRERLKLAVVDEFQDTSPIQLALFVKIHALAERSVWVGDRKQCIFEYAGADPLLMDAVASWVATSGGQQDALTVNYRSRPELVLACSELFASALKRHGFTRDEVVVTAKRETPSEAREAPAVRAVGPRYEEQGRRRFGAGGGREPHAGGRTLDARGRSHDEGGAPGAPGRHRGAGRDEPRGVAPRGCSPRARDPRGDRAAGVARDAGGRAGRCGAPVAARRRRYAGGGEDRRAPRVRRARARRVAPRAPAAGARGGRRHGRRGAGTGLGVAARARRGARASRCAVAVGGGRSGAGGARRRAALRALAGCAAARGEPGRAPWDRVGL